MSGSPLRPRARSSTAWATQLRAMTSGRVERGRPAMVPRRWMALGHPRTLTRLPLGHNLDALLGGHGVARTENGEALLGLHVVQHAGLDVPFPEPVLIV